jgi:hypothetical protein
MEILHLITNNLTIFGAAVDSVSQSDFVVTIIRMAAYIVPFFLIPAAFKAGMGAFSALTGMLSDRSRGFFDKQRKFRQGKYDYNKGRMKAGERFNNRGLNALTSKASTGGIPFTNKRRMAYQQKVNSAGNDFAKSAQAQGVQHNDGALQALTYGSAIEARAGLQRGDFGNKSESDINDAIAAAKAAGGFGRSRQVYAAAQLSRTGTGYENLEQVASTISRVSHGNTSQMAALAGDINASTKQVGRSDLAPGFGSLYGLSAAVGAGKAKYKDEDGVEREVSFAGDNRKQAFEAAAYEATASVDHMQAARNKGPGYKNNVKAVVERLKSNPDDADAEARLHDMINAGAYGSPGNQEALRQQIKEATRVGDLRPIFDEHVESALDAAARGRIAQDDRLTNPPGTPGADGTP